MSDASPFLEPMHNWLREPAGHLSNLDTATKTVKFNLSQLGLVSEEVVYNLGPFEDYEIEEVVVMFFDQNDGTEFTYTDATAL